MSDFIVSIKVRNGRLLRAMRRKYETPAKMTAATGISGSIISALLLMKISPLLKSGEWSKAAFDISSALAVEPEDLWPDHIARIKALRGEREFDMSVDDMAQISSGTEYAFSRSAIEKWTKGIPPKSVAALFSVASGATLEETGAIIGGGRERVRQRVSNAARRIRIAAKRDRVEHVEDMKT